jgi:hypothetical protein
MDNCTYNIHSVERIKSKNFFHIDPYSGSISIIQSLEKSINVKHLLTIIYQCQYISYITSTRLHINILDKKKLKNQKNNLYRFSQENYLIIFETSLINHQKKYLINLELINNDYQEKKIKPDAQIIEGRKKSIIKFLGVSKNWTEGRQESRKAIYNRACFMDSRVLGGLNFLNSHPTRQFYFSPSPIRPDEVQPEPDPRNRVTIKFAKKSKFS